MELCTLRGFRRRKMLIPRRAGKFVSLLIAKLDAAANNSLHRAVHVISVYANEYQTLLWDELFFSSLSPKLMAALPRTCDLVRFLSTGLAIKKWLHRGDTHGAHTSLSDFSPANRAVGSFLLLWLISVHDVQQPKNWVWFYICAIFRRSVRPPYTAKSTS